MDRDIAETPPPSRSRKWLIRIGLGLSGCTFVFLPVEIGLRAFEVSYPRTSQRDEYRGSARRPGIEWWQTEEGRAFIKINRAGFRDRERTLGKRPNTVRIAILGDSMVEALEVPTEQRFTEVLEHALNQRQCVPSKQIEVLNFGQSGYGTAQELMVLRHHVWAYQPDMVVLAVMTGNDVRNNSKQLQNDSGRPYFVFKDGELVFDDSFRNSPGHIKTWWERLGYGLIDWSRVGQLVYQARATLQKRRAVSEVRASFTDLTEDIGLDTLVYKEPTDSVWRDAWDVTEALLALMDKEVSERGAEFLVVTLSNTTQVHPDLSVRQRLVEKLGVETLSYPDDRIKAVGKREDFPVLNLAPLLQEYVRKQNAYLHGFPNTAMGIGHWNEQGHRVVAQFLTQAICSRAPSGADVQ